MLPAAAGRTPARGREVPLSTRQPIATARTAQRGRDLPGRAGTPAAAAAPNPDPSIPGDPGGSRVDCFLPSRNRAVVRYFEIATDSQPRVAPWQQAQPANRANLKDLSPVAMLVRCGSILVCGWAIFEYSYPWPKASRSPYAPDLRRHWRQVTFTKIDCAHGPAAPWFAASGNSGPFAGLWITPSACAPVAFSSL